MRMFLADSVGLPHPAHVAAFAAINKCTHATAAVPQEDTPRARLPGLEEDVFELGDERALGLSLPLHEQLIAAAPDGRHNGVGERIAPGITAERCALQRKRWRVLQHR